MRITAFILAFLGLLSSMAQPTARWEEGNRLYSAGQYDSAIVLYRSVLEEGVTAAALHYNLGNAYYRNQQLGRAILHYEKALRLDPHFADAAFNLALANSQKADRLPAPRQTIIAEWWRSFLLWLSPRSWGLLAIVLLWLAVALGAIVLLKRSAWRPTLLVTAIVLGFLSLSSLYLSQQRYRWQHPNPAEAIIIEPNAYVKAAPQGSATDLFILHEGTKVKVLKETSGWWQIALPDKKQGWIRADRLAKV